MKRKNPESWPFYLAVMKLRRRGYRVCRSGRNHLVNGVRLRTSKDVIRLARAEQ